ncbi:MAG: HupE/UreJ family protein [Cyanobacteriota bacterium]|jgi:urease accessory protein
MKRFTPSLIALTAGALALLDSHPARAHGSAVGGLLGGLSHPLLGLDHLLMLLAVGAAASLLSSRLLVWAGAGALVGAMAGAGGLAVPAAEVWAALAVAALGGLIWAAIDRRSPATERFAQDPADSPLVDGGVSRRLAALSGPLVAGGVAIHALLHAREAPAGASSLLWWSGALLSSLLVGLGAFQAFQSLPATLTKASAVAFLLLGGLLALVPLAARVGLAVA